MKQCKYCSVSNRGSNKNIIESYFSELCIKTWFCWPFSVVQDCISSRPDFQCWSCIRLEHKLLPCVIAHYLLNYAAELRLSIKPQLHKIPQSSKANSKIFFTIVFKPIFGRGKKEQFSAMLEMSEWKRCQKDFWKNDRWVVFSTQVMSIMTGISQCFPKDVRN